jgi:hypothetical protein
MKKKIWLFLPFILSVFSGCAGYVNQESFKEMLSRKPTREQVIQNMGKPLASQGKDWPIKIDRYHTAVLVYNKEGSLLYSKTFPKVEKSKALSNLWGNYMRLGYIKAMYLNTKPSQRTESLESIKQKVKIQARNYAQQARLQANQMQSMAQSKLQVANNMATGYAFSQSMSQQQTETNQQLSNINNSIQNLDSSGNVYNLGPSRVSQAGTSFGEGFGQGLVMGMQEGKAKSLYEASLEFMKVQLKLKNLTRNWN